MHNHRPLMLCIINSSQRHINYVCVYYNTVASQHWNDGELLIDQFANESKWNDLNNLCLKSYMHEWLNQRMKITIIITYEHKERTRIIGQLLMWYTKDVQFVYQN